MGARKLAVSKHEFLYTSLNPPHLLRWQECIYCGEVATCRDHFPPISRVDDYRSIGLVHEVFIKVPSCDECNLMLGDSLQDTFVERIEYIKNLLAKKYSTHIGSVLSEWDDEEISELGPRLGSKIRSIQNRRKYVTDRINYYDGLHWYLMQLKLNHQREFDF